MKKTCLLQTLKSPAMYLSIVCAALCCFISILPFWDKRAEGGAFYYFDLFLGLSMSKKLLVLCGAIPSVTLFCNDWNSQYITPLVIRCGIKKYALARSLTCFLTAFSASFLGIASFVTLLSAAIPLFDLNYLTTQVFPPFDALAHSSLPILYPLAQAFVFSLAMALWAMVGLTVSAYMPNLFVAVTAPIVASYLFDELAGALPPFLNVYLLTRSDDVLGRGPVLAFLYFLFYFLALSALLGLLFYFQIKRRLRSEIS